MFEGAGDVGFSVLDRDAEGFTKSEVGGDSGAKGTSGAMSVPCIDAGVPEDKEGVTRCEDVNAFQESSHPAAFDENSAAP